MIDELIVMGMLLLSAGPVMAQQVSVGIWSPGVSIGINLPLYPDLVPVPGYPVYYAPRLESNYFFYDGMYWVYQEDNWYASSWYNGPWGLVGPEYVPVYVLRIPVRYYRRPPVYFRGWQSDAPPRWHEHWGNQWAQRRSGWDRWDRHAVPARPPLPVYQRKYSGDRYPRAEQQQEIQRQNYRYQPRDPIVRQQYQAERKQSAPPVPVRRESQGGPPERNREQQNIHRPNPQPAVDQDTPRTSHTQVAPHEQMPQQQQGNRPEPQKGQQHEQRAVQQQQQQQAEQKSSPHDQREQRETRQPPPQQAPQESKRESKRERGRGNDRDDGHGRGNDRGQ
jgi:hypothetical protein